MRLVLVEGFPGSGKSTTAQWIATQLERQGRPVRWFYEYDAHHPVCDPRPDAFSHFRNWEEFAAGRYAQWQAFCGKAAGSDAVTVFESALLQNTMLTVLRQMVPQDSFLALFKRIGSLIRPLGPRLVYFSQHEPEKAYEHMALRRGEKYVESVVRRFEASPFARVHRLKGLSGLLQYWREQNRVTDEAVAMLGMATVVIASHEKDWVTRRATIARFLDIAMDTQPPVALCDLNRYVGRYRVRTEGDMPLDWARVYADAAAPEAEVSVRDGALVLDGVLWPGNRLIPGGNGSFYAEGWPLEVGFDCNSRESGGELYIRVSPDPSR